MFLCLLIAAPFILVALIPVLMLLSVVFGVVFDDDDDDARFS
jgi:hypothetical protein